jgi:hypothetical protein
MELFSRIWMILCILRRKHILHALPCPVSVMCQLYLCVGVSPTERVILSFFQQVYPLTQSEDGSVSWVNTCVCWTHGWPWYYKNLGKDVTHGTKHQSTAGLVQWIYPWIPK